MPVFWTSWRAEHNLGEYDEYDFQSNNLKKAG